MADKEGAVPWLAVGLLSGTALAYEVLLTRLFALVHWHHLAATIISLALLGYGASGTFLNLLHRRLVPWFAPVFVANALLFGASLAGSFALASHIALDPLALAWEPAQLLHLAAIFTLMAVPFFAVANCIGLTLWRFRDEVHRIYATDLAGAGLGAPAVVGLLVLFPPGDAMTVLAALALAGAVIGAITLRWQRLPVAVLALGGIVSLGLVDVSTPRPAAYKDLARALTVLGAEVEAQSAGPLGVVTIVRNDAVPHRHAPGLSLLPRASPPAQRALFVDGDAAGALVAFDGVRAPAYLRDQTSAMPYAVLDRPRVVVLDAGAGEAVLQALAHGAVEVQAVEWHADLVELLQTQFRDFTGALYDRREVSVHRTESRAFLARSTERFDLIQLAAGSDPAGLTAQREHYGLTGEAFAAALDHLAPGGVLAVSGGTRLPPRLSLRLVATAIAALEREGVTRPGEHLAMVRGWQYFTLLMSREPWSAEAVGALRAFARQRNFDLVWLPGMQRSEANRVHRLAEPVFHDGVRALLAPGRDAFVAAYPFMIEPATDDRPYPRRFVRAASIPRLWNEPGGRGLGQLDWGYVVAVATLLLALTAGAVLILLPLLLAVRVRRSTTAGWRWRAPLYFALVGVAFLFIELACIQRFQLFLGHPLYAIALVLTGFLVLAGLGSLASRRWSAGRAGWGLRLAVGVIVATVVLYVTLLPAVFAGMNSLAAPWRALGGLILLAPLAFAMGMPFPLGLARLGAEAPQLLPWAWGVNGCASVVSAVAAPLLAMEIGFSGVLLSAALLYALTPLVLPKQISPVSPGLPVCDVKSTGP
jgi:hypothetical protein